MPSPNLSGVNLSGADLRWSDLRKTNLSGVNLSAADLGWTNLSGANLSGANLSGADLTCADLGWTNLSGANLSGADLGGVDLTGANLTGVMGISSMEEEIAECDRLLRIFRSGKGKVDMNRWHTCDTTHCLAGWVCLNEVLPASTASRKIPSLAWMFYRDDMSQGEVIEELQKIVGGRQVTR